MDGSGYTACGSVTNWIDQVIVKYNTTYLYSYNFAYGYVSRLVI